MSALPRLPGHVTRGSGPGCQPALHLSDGRGVPILAGNLLGSAGHVFHPTNVAPEGSGSLGARRDRASVRQPGRLRRTTPKTLGDKCRPAGLREERVARLVSTHDGAVLQVPPRLAGEEGLMTAFSEANRRAVVAAWQGARSAGIDQEDFARQHGISGRALRSWIRRYSPRQPTSVDGIRRALLREIAALNAALGALDRAAPPPNVSEVEPAVQLTSISPEGVAPSASHVVAGVLPAAAPPEGTIAGTLASVSGTATAATGVAHGRTVVGRHSDAATVNRAAAPAPVVAGGTAPATSPEGRKASDLAKPPLSRQAADSRGRDESSWDIG